VGDTEFFNAIQSFKGASKRLEVLANTDKCIVFKDFAHAPSKALASLGAVRVQYPRRKVIACVELHTYSSLSKEFMRQYAGTLDQADVAIVYYNPHALQLKRLPEITPQQIREGFGNSKLEVFNQSAELNARLLREPSENSVFLMMSSGNYDGIDLNEFATQVSS
ncbi:MAG: peptidoglycan synthetase, partial [Bacteroidota bacterium]